MNKQRFTEACEEIVNRDREQNGIGTLREKTLHAVLKRYFEPDCAKHEKSVGSFIADIASDSGIIEIQTRAFEKLRKKLTDYLEVSPVTVVYPMPQTKWLIWIDEQTGETTKKRKSPRQGRIYDAIVELYKIKSLFNHANFRLCIVFVDLDEYRYLNGWSQDKKRGSTRFDRIPVEITEELYFDCAADYMRFLPKELDSQFTTKDYKTATGVDLYTSQLALGILRQVGMIERVGKRGNLNVYSRRP